MQRRRVGGEGEGPEDKSGIRPGGDAQHPGAGVSPSENQMFGRKINAEHPSIPINVA
jgi:hypothetical protein